MTNIIGLARRARKVTIGTELTIEKLRRGEVYVIILATDASENTQKKVYDKAKTYACEVVSEHTSDELSNAIGKHDIKVIGITDRGFSQLLMNERRK